MLWAKLIGAVAVTAAFFGAAGFALKQARGFVDDQYERGRAEMSALVEAATLKAKDEARIKAERLADQESERRRGLERRAAVAESAAAAALAKLKGSNADVSRCMALDWPDNVRRHFPVIMRDEVPAANNGSDRDREAAAAIGS